MAPCSFNFYLIFLLLNTISSRVCVCVLGVGGRIDFFLGDLRLLGSKHFLVLINNVSFVDWVVKISPHLSFRQLVWSKHPY